VSARRRNADLLPSSDTVSVAWNGETAVVKHYPPASRRVCCTVKVTITDADLAQAFDFELTKGSVAALTRASLAIDKKHAAK